MERLRSLRPLNGHARGERLRLNGQRGAFCSIGVGQRFRFRGGHGLDRHAHLRFNAHIRVGLVILLTFLHARGKAVEPRRGVDIVAQPIRHLHQPFKGKRHLDQRHRPAGYTAANERFHIELAAHTHAAQIRLHALHCHRAPVHQGRARVQRGGQRDAFLQKRFHACLRRQPYGAYGFGFGFQVLGALNAGNDFRRGQPPQLQLQPDADQKDHVSVFIFRFYMLYLARDAAGHIAGRARKFKGVVELGLRRQRAQRGLAPLPVYGLAVGCPLQHHAAFLHIHLPDDQVGFGHQRFNRIPARAGHNRLRAQKRLPLPRTDQFLDFEGLLQHAYRHRKNLPTAFRLLCLCVGRMAHAPK